MKTWKFSKNRVPTPGEICTITNIKIIKPAALLFDRIFVGTRTKPDNDDRFHDVPEEFTFGISAIDWEAVDSIKLLFDKLREKNIEPSKLPIAYAVNLTSKVLSSTYCDHGYRVIPSYDSEVEFIRDFHNGTDIAYKGTLNNIIVVDNDSAEWEQILEFRNDKEATKRYRALRIWLRDGLTASSVEEATEKIGKRIDDYEWAIKKHGLKTISGTLSQVFDLKTISSIATGAGLSGFLGGPIWSSIAAGLIVSARIGAYLFEKHLELNIIKREEYSEIALLHEARKLLRGS